MSDTSKQNIAVVGGGLAGLEFAVRAAEGGAEVEVFEAGPQTRARHVYWDTKTHPGDEKVQTWTSDNWGAGGGLSLRLGGRSLCYHGVLLGLEDTARATWGSPWVERLTGDDGLYAEILSELRPDFPELNSTDWPSNGRLSALRHVPQAARIDDRNRFESYTPLTRALELADEGRIHLTREHVQSVGPDAGGWLVHAKHPTADEKRRRFDTCVLASSAIGNVQILSSSLGRHLVTPITDHFCVGVFLRLLPGQPLRPFRHRMLEGAFVPCPQIFANIFFLEHPAIPNGDRLVQIQAVIEQQGGPGAFSTLSVNHAPEGVHTHIRANISQADHDHLDAVGAELVGWARRLAGDSKLEEVVPDHAAPTASGNRYGSGAPWFGHDEAREAVKSHETAGVFSRYDVPYGAFEHEACTHPLGGKGSVPVSTDLEVVEMPGVYVLGLGAFPRLGTANPALTLLALSRWLGDRLTGA